VAFRTARTPAQKRYRYESELGLSAYDACVLTDDQLVADYFEAVSLTGLIPNKPPIDHGRYRCLPQHQKTQYHLNFLKPTILAELLTLIEDGTISGKIAKDILPELLTKVALPRN